MVSEKVPPQMKICVGCVVKSCLRIEKNKKKHHSKNPIHSFSASLRLSRMLGIIMIQQLSVR